MPIKFIKRTNYKFSLILIVGIVLRIIYFILLYETVYPDTETHILLAQLLAQGKYPANREPTFPFFVFLLLLITGNGVLAVKLTSMIFGILTIYVSYFVFKKISLKIFKDDINAEKKTEHIALFVSLFYAINVTIISNSVHGLRESLLSFLLLLIVYYVFIKENNENLKDKIIIVVLMSSLTLVHLTAGIFTFIAILLGYLILKLNIIDLDFNISKNNLLLITVSFIVSISWWFIHSTIVAGHPLHAFRIGSSWMRKWTDYDDSTLPKLIGSIIYGFEAGFLTQFQIFAYEVGLLFTLLAVFSILRYYDRKEMFFLGIILIFNLLSLTMFLAFYPDARLLLHFFPFLYYLGFLTIVDIWYENTEKQVKIELFNKRFIITINHIFILFIIIFITAYFFYHMYFISIFIQSPDEIIEIYKHAYENLMVLQSLMLILILLISYYYDKSLERKIEEK